MKYPKVTLIISNINGMSLNLLPECINSLTKIDYPNWELIVIDNCSTDNSVEFLKKRFLKLKNCQVIQNPINMYSHGINLAVKNAKGKYIANFNNDLSLKRNYITLLINELLKDTTLGIVQGKLLNYYDRTLVDTAGETMDIYGNPVTIGSKEKSNLHNDAKEILSACGAACVFKKTLFNKIGKYDPEYGIGYEDMDFSLRARRLGYTIKMVPEAICYHKRAKTDVADFVKHKVKWHFNKNRITTMIKNYPLGLLIKSLPLTVLLYFGIAFWEWIVNRNWRMGYLRISSLFWVTVHLHQIFKKRRRINKLGALPLSEKDLQLFSKRSLMDSFNTYTGTK